MEWDITRILKVFSFYFVLLSFGLLYLQHPKFIKIKTAAHTNPEVANFSTFKFVHPHFACRHSCLVRNIQLCNGVCHHKQGRERDGSAIESPKLESYFSRQQAALWYVSEYWITLRGSNKASGWTSKNIDTNKISLEESHQVASRPQYPRPSI